MSNFINWGSESPEQLAIRKRMEEYMVFEQATFNAAIASAAGGSRLPNKTTSIQTAFVSYVNTNTNTWEFFCASPIDGSFSTPHNTQIPDTFNRNTVYPLNLGGYAAVFNLGSSWDIFFVSTDGVVLSRLEIPISTSLNISVDHNVNQLIIVDNDSRVLWTWDGSTLYDHHEILAGDVVYQVGTNGDNFIANGSLVVKVTTPPAAEIQIDEWYFVKNGVATLFLAHDWTQSGYRLDFSAFSGSNNMVSWSYDVVTNYITGYGITNEEGTFSASGPINLVGITSINWSWYGEENSIWMSGNDQDNTWMFNWDASIFATNLTIPRLPNSELSTTYDRISASSEYDQAPSNLFVATHGEWTGTYYINLLQSVNNFTLIYKFPGQTTQSFTIAGESYFQYNVQRIGESIFIGVFDQGLFRFIKITSSTPSLEGVTTIAELRSYFVPDLEFNIESYVSYLDLTQSSTGIVFKSYIPSTNSSQITHYNGGDWLVAGNTLTVTNWDISANNNWWKEAGAFLLFAGEKLVAWLPSNNEWQTVLEEVIGYPSIFYTRARFNAAHRDGSRFVVIDTTNILNSKIVTPSQIIPLLGVPENYESIRVGETGLYTFYQDVNRDFLYSINFWDFDGNLKWKFDTQYTGWSGSAFTDTRAISRLIDHATVMGQSSIIIGNLTSAQIKEMPNSTNVDYDLNDAAWWD